jgi:membrane protease YdiL (CAAX protease family)
MPPLTFRTFLQGPDPEREPSPWHPLAAFLVALFIVAIGQLVPIIAAALLAAGERVGGGGGDAQVMARIYAERTGALLVLAQAVMAIATLAVAGRGRPFSQVLALVPANGGARVYLFAGATMAVLLAVLNFITYQVAPESFLADFRQFRELVKGPEPWLMFAAIGIGAPMWEEMLFRGFLLPPLAKMTGFWPAALATSGLWTGLHLGYSLIGLGEVFLIGLFFAWLMRRTGSLWVPIACHGAYNALLFLALRFYT